MGAIRTARTGDLEELERVYAAARHYMASHGNPTQWGSSEPSRSVLEEDIAARRLYVMEEDGEIFGAFAMIPGRDPTYSVIEGGSWLHDDRPYGTIHRLAGDGSRRGLFRSCVAFCKEICPELRADTHENNSTMRHLLEKSGFVQRGVIRVEDGTPRIAYQLTD